LPKWKKRRFKLAEEDKDKGLTDILAGAVGGALGGPIGAVGLPLALDFFQNRGSNKAQSKAMNEQLKLARAMFDLQKEQSEMDLPFRKDLYSALRQRNERSVPQFMQRSFQATNPYANLKRVAPSMSQLQKTEEGQFLNPQLARALQQRIGETNPVTFKEADKPKVQQNPLVGSSNVAPVRSEIVGDNILTRAKG